MYLPETGYNMRLLCMYLWKGKIFAVRRSIKFYIGVRRHRQPNLENWNAIFLFWVCLASRESGAFFTTFRHFDVVHHQKSFREPYTLKSVSLNFKASPENVIKIGGTILRKYKKVKEKKVTYTLEEWQEIEKRAAALSMKTGTYIRQISVNGQITCYTIKNVAPIMNALRIIGNNINQIAKKANEINNIYADDIEKLRKENYLLCHTLNQFLSELLSTKV